MEGTAGKPDVKTWDELMAQPNSSPAVAAKTALLLGNGFSIAICDRFQYKTLKEKSSLADEKLKLFEHLGSSDFERVLALLDDVKAALPNKFEGVESEFKSLHTEIQNALLTAVEAVHPEHKSVKNPVRAVNSELLKFAEVYTVNYDLLLYWALNAVETNTKRFVDFFYSGEKNEFHLEDDHSRNKRTAIYYLHGALHLQWQEGQVRKINAKKCAESLKQLVSHNHYPLFICEGRGEEKQRRIGENPYLHFAYNLFCALTDIEQVTVLGCSLADRHLVTPLLKWLERKETHRLWISAFGADEATRTKNASEIEAKLEAADPKNSRILRNRIHYFDSQTHPIMKAISRAIAQKS